MGRTAYEAKPTHLTPRALNRTRTGTTAGEATRKLLQLQEQNPMKLFFRINEKPEPQDDTTKVICLFSLLGNNSEINHPTKKIT